jgi:hypothetical protein
MANVWGKDGGWGKRGWEDPRVWESLHLLKKKNP